MELDYKDPKTAFGFGRSLLAIDVKSREVLWSHREEKHLDGRAVSLSGMSKSFGLPGLRVGWLATRDTETRVSLSDTGAS